MWLFQASIYSGRQTGGETNRAGRMGTSAKPTGADAAVRDSHFAILRDQILYYRD